MAPNRRSHPRYIKRIRSRARDEKDGAWRLCFTADVSASGIFFESSWIPRFARIEVEVYVDDKQPFVMVGQLVRGARVPPQLVRAAKGGFAVRLTDMPPTWGQYCASLGAAK